MNNRAVRGVYSLTEWITKFAYLNILWIGFTLLGLVIFGFLPATVALFTILRKWIMGEYETPIFQTFWETYKKDFFKSNLMGIVFVLLAVLAYIDLYFMDLNGGSGLQVTHIPLYLMILAIAMTVLYTIPVYVHYNVGFVQVFKNAFLIMLLNPIPNVLMLAGVVSTLFVMNALPALLFIFGGSFTAAIIMASCYLAFQRIDKKQKEAHSI
ncbi:YesL family protein [Bacillus salacetis]|uniref:YesL family protein n=1 Tax=Bacillus salacetis TaxID=2315464 RepID=UPI003BA2185C